MSDSKSEIQFILNESVTEDDSLIDIMDASIDKILERGTLTDYVGVGDFDLNLNVYDHGDSHYVAVDIYSENPDFDVEKVRWEDIAVFVMDELTDRDFFSNLDESLGIDAYTEKAICLSEGKIIKDWGYLA